MLRRRRDRAEEVQREARRLVDEYGDLALRLAYTYLGSRQDSEDVSQDVLCKLLCRKDPFNSPEHERAWVIRCTSNACKDLLRSASRRRNVSLDQVAEVPDATAETDADDVPGEVTRAVMGLPPTYREVIYLHYYEDMSLRQIAEAVGTSEGAVAKRLSRARAELRERLEGTSDERHGGEVSGRDGSGRTHRGAEGQDGAGGCLCSPGYAR